MNKPNTIIMMLVAVLLVVGSFSKSDSKPSVQRVEDFSSVKDGSFPEGWESRGGDLRDVYRIRSTHEAYLEARAVNSAVAIAKKFDYDLNEYPYLKWQWRVYRLPRGGDERVKERGDSAAAIYVIFDGFFRPDTIKYVWSSSLPLGTTTESPYNGKTKIVVLQNQHSPLEQWITESVNVEADYKRLFKKEPERVQAIGLMSDSDNTSSVSIAHYKEIAVSIHKSAR